MNILAFETDDMCPVAAWCDENDLHIKLADGRTISAPLWWHPFLLKASDDEKNNIELQYSGVWWPEVDEGVSVKSIFMGWKSPNAKEPKQAAE